MAKVELSTAPFTGGIASSWSEWDTERRFRRVEFTIRELGEQLSRSKAFDAGKLGDAEMQLLEDILQRAAREHREEKRAMFARLLAANWVNTNSPFEERLLFQRALDEFGLLHIQILREISDAHSRGEELLSSKDICNRVFGEGADEQTRIGVFVPAVNKLAAEYGFVRRRLASDAIYVVGSPEGRAFRNDCCLSTLGCRFLDSVNGGVDSRPASATV